MDPDIVVVVDIARPPHEVRAWWTDIADDYRATDPKEQPHHIIVKRRTQTEREMLTYWRGPLGREIVVPETMRIDTHGDFAVDITLPMGLAQRDEFTLEPTKDGTRVTIRVRVWPRSLAGKAARPVFMRYARKAYARTWRAAGRICERDAPRIPVGEASASQ